MMTMKRGLFGILFYFFSQLGKSAQVKLNLSLDGSRLPERFLLRLAAAAVALMEDRCGES